MDLVALSRWFSKNISMKYHFIIMGILKSDQDAIGSTCNVSTIKVLFWDIDLTTDLKLDICPKNSRSLSILCKVVYTITSQYYMTLKYRTVPCV